MIQFFGSRACLGDQFPGHLGNFPKGQSEMEERAPGEPRVLVVDDERLLADTTAAILRRAGFVAKSAYDGFEALESMASFHPDYLLTDIMMPAMNGIDLAIAITKMYPRTKIMLFSGQAGISQLLQDSKTQGYEFPLLAKPVHPSKLVEGIKGLGNS